MKHKSIKLMEIITILIIIFIDLLNPIYCLISEAVESEDDTTNETLKRLADVVEIGDYVNYDANSGLITPLTYTTDNSLTGGDTGIEFSSADNMNWRVFSIDEESGIVELISSTVANMDFGGKNGYINYENVVNNIGAIYGHGMGATGGRSINLDDIEKFSSFDKNSYSWNGYNYGYIYTFTSGKILMEDGTVIDARNSNFEMKMTGYEFDFDKYNTNEEFQELLDDQLPFWIASRGTQLFNTGKDISGDPLYNLEVGYRVRYI